MIRSAMLIESEIAATNFGDGGPPFQSANLRAAKIDAAISKTRFRPSSMFAEYHIFAFYSPTALGPFLDGLDSYHAIEIRAVVQGDPATCVGGQVTISTPIK